MPSLQQKINVTREITKQFNRQHRCFQRCKVLKAIARTKLCVNLQQRLGLVKQKHLVELRQTSHKKSFKVQDTKEVPKVFTTEAN